ncbi:MAG: sulfatase-like hydrolase/transferase [Spirochaetota bacterium]
MSRQPNILWLMTDEQRTDSLGCYGSPWVKTPCLDRLAREGVVFENAITPAPACVPARVSIATGKMPHETGCWHNEWRAEEPLAFLTHHFADAGYQTAGFGKMHFNAKNKAFQTQEEITLSSHVDYFDYAKIYDESEFDVVKYPGDKSRWILGGKFPAPLEETSEHIVASKALDWLAGRDTQKPFLLKVSFNGPHTPVVPPAPYDTMIREGDIRFPDNTMHFPADHPEWTSRLIQSGYADASRLSMAQQRAMRRYYYGYASFLDMEFGRVISYLEKENILDNTIIAFTSDHGTHLGDFGLIQKQTFFDPVIRVPLIFRYPNAMRSGTRLSSPASTASLLPTLLDAAGISPPADVAPSLTSSSDTDKASPVMSEFMYTPQHIRRDDKFMMIRDRSWKLSFVLDAYPRSAMLTATNDRNERDRIHEKSGVADLLFGHSMAHYAGQGNTPAPT